MKLVKLLTILLLVVFAVSSVQAQKTKAKKKAVEETVQPVQPAYVPPPPAPDGVFIQLSSGVNNPQSVLMALSMALKMSQDHEVLLFMDLQGPEIVLSKAQSLEMKHFDPSKITIQKLIERGVKLVVCPTCLEVMNKTEFDLIKGVKVAAKDDLFDFTKGRFLCFTY
jgi:predicted peroxiredoxin